MAKSKTLLAAEQLVVSHRGVFGQALEEINHVLTVTSALNEAAERQDIGACFGLAKLLDKLAVGAADLIQDHLDGQPDLAPTSDCGYKAAEQWVNEFADRFDENKIKTGTGFAGPIKLEIGRFYDPLTPADKRKFVEALGTLVMEHLIGTTPVFEAWEPEKELAWMARAHLADVEDPR